MIDTRQDHKSRSPGFCVHHNETGFRLLGIMRGYVDKVRMRHAESASMRNHHKGLERRWFEQCAYFCTCHSLRQITNVRRLHQGDCSFGRSDVSDFRRFVHWAATCLAEGTAFRIDLQGFLLDQQHEAIRSFLRPGVRVSRTKVRKVPQDSCQLPGRKGFSAIPELPRRDLV